MHTRSKGQEPLPYEDEIERRFRNLRRFCNEVQTQGTMDNEEQKSLRDYAMPRIDEIKSSITRPAITANTFEIKPGTIQMIQNSVQFGGLANDDPNEHLVSFLEICDTFKYHNVTDDAVRLRLFPFTLRDKAKNWLHSLPPGSITTWDDLAQKFLAKFFPPAKTAKMRNEITTFEQLHGESLYEAWERFKELLRRCPHHGLPKWLQVQTFYNGLSSNTRTSIDAAAGGALMAKNFDEAFDLLETMAANNYQWPTARMTQPKAAGILDVDAVTALSAQISALAQKMDIMGRANMQQVAVVCELCAGAHPMEQCAINPEAVQFVGSYNRQQQQFGGNSNNYNPGWRNHSNFSWRDNQAQVPRPAQPPGFQARQQQQQPQQERKSDFEEFMTKYMKDNETWKNSHDVALRNIENQIGQLATALNNRPQGTLPGTTEVNPRNDGKEQCKAVTLRSGKQLEDEATFSPKKVPEKEEKSDENKEEEKKVEDDSKAREKTDKPAAVIPAVPFPQRFQK